MESNSKDIEGRPSAPCSALLDAALDLLAGWCDAVKNGGTGWDDWDEWYKDACYRPGPLREMIDARMAKIAAEESQCPKCHATRIYYDGWNCPTEGCDSLPNATAQLPPRSGSNSKQDASGG
jgi:hypothetical protein